MRVSDVNTEYLDKGAAQLLIDELKAYADKLTTGSVDLSDYVTKNELQSKLDAFDIHIDLSAYVTKEELTTAINNIDLSSYALKSEMPTLDGYATTEYVDNVVADVANFGGNFADMENYYTKDDVYSKEEIDSMIPDVKDGVDGKDGEDGFSPIISVSQTENGHLVQITDINGAKDFEVLNGKDGQNGLGGGGSSGGITYTYDTEIATGETWIDGKPIYLKVFHVSALSSQPSANLSYSNYHAQDKFADEIISVIPRWSREDTAEIITGNTLQMMTGAASSSSTATAVGNVNSAVLSRLIWCSVSNNTNFHIIIGRGKAMYKFACDVFVKYTKI